MHAEPNQGQGLKGHLDQPVLEILADGVVWVHQGERSERERPATGKADKEVRVRAATCPQGASTKRATGGASWNVLALILDTQLPASREDRGAIRGPRPQRRVKDRALERYDQTPYGIATVDQESYFGDYGERSERERPATGKANREVRVRAATCPQGASTKRATGGGDVDAADKTVFDALVSADTYRRPGRSTSALGNTRFHQGLILDPEIGSFNNRARQYAPQLKRFMQRDPWTLQPHPMAGLPKRITVYAYLGGNPLVRGDEQGLHWQGTSHGGGFTLEWWPDACQPAGAYFVQFINYSSNGDDVWVPIFSGRPDPDHCEPGSGAAEGITFCKGPIIDTCVGCDDRYPIQGVLPGGGMWMEDNPSRPGAGYPDDPNDPGPPGDPGGPVAAWPDGLVVVIDDYGAVIDSIDWEGSSDGFSFNFP